MKSVFKKLKVRRSGIDVGLLFAVVLCSVISVLLIFSISSNKVLDKVGDSYWQTQLVSLVMGVVLALIISLLDYSKLAKLWFVYAPIALGLTMLVFTSLGYQREGADDRAWLNLGFIQFQPSEILKIAFILTFSLHLSRIEEKMNKPLNMLLLCIHGGVPVALIGLQGDYGTAIVFASIFLFMMISADRKSVV